MTTAGDKTITSLQDFYSAMAQSLLLGKQLFSCFPSTTSLPTKSLCGAQSIFFSGLGGTQHLKDQAQKALYDDTFQLLLQKNLEDLLPNYFCRGTIMLLKKCHVIATIFYRLKKF